MRVLVLLLALAMPTVAWMDQQQLFGPGNGAVSDMYPTLLVAAGYAFSVWGLIFLLDIVYAALQLRRGQAPVLQRIAPWAAVGFGLTGAWMPLFSAGAAQPALFWLCLLVMLGALACMLRCMLMLHDARQAGESVPGWAWWPLSIHAGWLSLAAFLNIAQVIVAFALLPVDDMGVWSLLLLAVAALLVLGLNQRMRGNVGFVLVGVWGLAAMYVKQSASMLPGSTAVAWAALGLIGLLLVQTLWLRVAARRT